MVQCSIIRPAQSAWQKIIFFKNLAMVTNLSWAEPSFSSLDRSAPSLARIPSRRGAGTGRRQSGVLAASVRAIGDVCDGRRGPIAIGPAAAMRRTGFVAGVIWPSCRRMRHPSPECLTDVNMTAPPRSGSQPDRVSTWTHNHPSQFSRRLICAARSWQHCRLHRRCDAWPIIHLRNAWHHEYKF